MPTEKPAGAYQMLSKSRAMYRGNPLLTLDHLQFFKPVEVPKEIAVQNRSIKETIVVNPLTGVVEVSGIALFSSSRIRNAKYKLDYRVWNLSESAKTYLEELTGHKHTQVVSYNDTLDSTPEQTEGKNNFTYIGNFITNVKKEYIDNIKLLPVNEDYIDNLHMVTNLTDGKFPNPLDNILLSPLEQFKKVENPYQKALNSLTDSAGSYLMVSRDMVIDVRHLHLFNQFVNTKIVKNSGPTGNNDLVVTYTPSEYLLLQGKPAYSVDHNDESTDYRYSHGNDVRQQVTNYNVVEYSNQNWVKSDPSNNYVSSLLPHGGLNRTGGRIFYRYPSGLQDTTFTDFLQLLPYRYTFTIKGIDIVTFYLDLIQNKLWTTPEAAIQLDSQLHQGIATPYFNKVYTENSLVGDTINSIYPTGYNDKLWTDGQVMLNKNVLFQNVNDRDMLNLNNISSFKIANMVLGGDNNYNKCWRADTKVKRTLPIKGFKLGVNDVTFSHLVEEEHRNNVISANKNINVVLEDDTVVNIYKYLVDNNYIPEREEDGQLITLALSDQGDFPTLISYQFKAYPNWWQLTWTVGQNVPAFSAHYQLSHKDGRPFTARKLTNNEFLVVMREDDLRWSGFKMNDDYSKMKLHERASGPISIEHNFLKYCGSVDNWRFGPNKLKYADAVLELVYGNWCKSAVPHDVEKDLSKLPNQNKVNLLSTLTFNNIDTPWWGTISIWISSKSSLRYTRRYVRSFIDNAREMGLTPMEFWILITLAFVHGYRTRWVKINPVGIDPDRFMQNLKSLANDPRYFKDIMTKKLNKYITEENRRDLIPVRDRLSTGQEHDDNLKYAELNYKDPKDIFDFSMNLVDFNIGNYIPHQRVLSLYWLPKETNTISTGSATFNFGNQYTVNEYYDKTANNPKSINGPINNSPEHGLYAYNAMAPFVGYEMGNTDNWSVIMHHNYPSSYIFGIKPLESALIENVGYTFIGTANQTSEDLRNRLKESGERVVFVDGYDIGDVPTTPPSPYLLPYIALTISTFQTSVIHENMKRNSILYGYFDSFGMHTTDNAYSLDNRYYGSSGTIHSYKLLSWSNSADVLIRTDIVEKPIAEYANDTNEYGWFNEENNTSLKRGIRMTSDVSIANLFLSMCYARKLRIRIGMASKRNEDNYSPREIARIRHDLKYMGGWKYDDLAHKVTMMDFFVDAVLVPDETQFSNFFDENKKRNRFNKGGVLLRNRTNSSTPMTEEDRNYFTEAYGETINNDVLNHSGEYERKLDDYYYNHLYGMRGREYVFHTRLDDDGQRRFNDWAGEQSSLNIDSNYYSLYHPLMYHPISSGYKDIRHDLTDIPAVSYRGPLSKRAIHDYMGSMKSGYSVTLAPWLDRYNSHLSYKQIQSWYKQQDTLDVTNRFNVFKDNDYLFDCITPFYFGVYHFEECKATGKTPMRVTRHLIKPTVEDHPEIFVNDFTQYTYTDFDDYLDSLGHSGNDHNSNRATVDRLYNYNTNYYNLYNYLDYGAQKQQKDITIGGLAGFDSGKLTKPISPLSGFLNGWKIEKINKYDWKMPFNNRLGEYADKPNCLYIDPISQTIIRDTKIVDDINNNTIMLLLKTVDLSINENEDSSNYGLSYYTASEPADRYTTISDSTDFNHLYNVMCKTSWHDRSSNNFISSLDIMLRHAIQLQDLMYNESRYIINGIVSVHENENEKISNSWADGYSYSYTPKTDRDKIKGNEYNDYIGSTIEALSINISDDSYYTIPRTISSSKSDNELNANNDGNQYTIDANAHPYIPIDAPKTISRRYRTDSNYFKYNYIYPNIRYKGVYSEYTNNTVYKYLNTTQPPLLLEIDALYEDGGDETDYETSSTTEMQHGKWINIHREYIDTNFLAAFGSLFIYK